MKLKIKANQIKGFADFLLSLELKGTKSRMRTRLVKLLDGKLKDVQSEFIEQVVKEHCHLDEEGNPKTKDANGQKHWDIKEDKQGDFDKEYLDLWNETHVIEGEDNKVMFVSVKESVLNCEIAFSGQDAFIYDQWCDLVLAMDEDN